MSFSGKQELTSSRMNTIRMPRINECRYSTLIDVVISLRRPMLQTKSLILTWMVHFTGFTEKLAEQKSNS